MVFNFFAIAFYVVVHAQIVVVVLRDRYGVASEREGTVLVLATSFNELRHSSVIFVAVAQFINTYRLVGANQLSVGMRETKIRFADK